MLDVVPGKEEEFRYAQGWLAASDRLDRLIAATDPPGEAEPQRLPLQAPSPRRQPVAGRLAQSAGQALQRIGEALEAWGSPRPTAETDAPCYPGAQGSS
jgi:hypothetical protein